MLPMPALGCVFAVDATYPSTQVLYFCFVFVFALEEERFSTPVREISLLTASDLFDNGATCRYCCDLLPPAELWFIIVRCVSGCFKKSAIRGVFFL